MTATMKAAIFLGKNRIELTDKKIPPVGPNDALVKITTTTICGTDIHILRGEWNRIRYDIEPDQGGPRRMKTLYLDCFAGIAGDMLIGALLGLLPAPERFRAEMRRLTLLPEDSYELVIERGMKNGIAGTNFDVRTHEHHPHRGLHEIEEIVGGSALSDRVRRESLRAFALLAEAEAQVHGTTPDKIHFHEVGAIDSIVDIVGAFVLMELLDWPRVLCSPLNVGSGTVTCAHGVLPVPAPATALLLRGLPIFSRGAPMERTTPTGALLARTLASAFCSIPAGSVIASSFGLGNRDSEDMPNVLRVLLMEAGQEDEGLMHERLALLECNIDDMNPQDFEPVSGRLFEAGALDVWTEPIYMKKGPNSTPSAKSSRLIFSLEC